MQDFSLMIPYPPKPPFSEQLSSPFSFSQVSSKIIPKPPSSEVQGTQEKRTENKTDTMFRQHTYEMRNVTIMNIKNSSYADTRTSITAAISKARIVTNVTKSGDAGIIRSEKSASNRITVVVQFGTRTYADVCQGSLVRTVLKITGSTGRRLAFIFFQMPFGRLVGTWKRFVTAYILLSLIR